MIAADTVTQYAVKDGLQVPVASASSPSVRWPLEGRGI